jgi:hypothetical protein
MAAVKKLPLQAPHGYTQQRCCGNAASIPKAWRRNKNIQVSK